MDDSFYIESREQFISETISDIIESNKHLIEKGWVSQSEWNLYVKLMKSLEKGYEKYYISYLKDIYLSRCTEKTHLIGMSEGILLIIYRYAIKNKTKVNKQG